jgi:hypothetical protein
LVAQPYARQQTSLASPFSLTYRSSLLSLSAGKI